MTPDIIPIHYKTLHYLYKYLTKSKFPRCEVEMAIYQHKLSGWSKH